MKCLKIIKLLEELAPLKYAEDWDNPGLLAGRAEKDIHKIMVALDPSETVISQAVEQNVDMLITHHPMIFKPIKKISTQSFIGRKLVKLIQNDISYYAMHTNFDCAMMALEAGRRLGLKNIRVLESVYEEKLYKIAVFVPENQADKVRQALLEIILIVRLIQKDLEHFCQEKEPILLLEKKENFLKFMKLRLKQLWRKVKKNL